MPEVVHTSLEKTKGPIRDLMQSRRNERAQPGAVESIVDSMMDGVNGTMSQTCCAVKSVAKNSETHLWKLVRKDVDFDGDRCILIYSPTSSFSIMVQCTE